MSSAFATEIAWRIVLVVRAAPGIELGAQGPGEQNRIGLADDDPAADVAQAEILEGRLAEQDAAALPESSEPVRDRRRLVRPGGDDAGDEPGLDDEARALVSQRDARRRLGGGRLGIGDVRLDVQHVEHASGADERARDLVHRLRGSSQRDDEERRVPVERDELADVDLPGHREPGAEPGDDHDEEPRDEDLCCVERRLRERDADAGVADLLRAVAIAVVERLLAADPAQHPQPGGGVRPERRQLADLLALDPAAAPGAA